VKNPNNKRADRNSIEEESLFAEERRMKILNLLADRKKISVVELCDKLGVSATTIRNDLRDLEAARQLLRTHGGAIERPGTGHESGMREREVQNREAKQAIARIALNQIEDSDTILLDTGTTIRELAHILHERKGLTVVTNDLTIVDILEEFPTISVVLIGGVVRKGFHCTLGIHGEFGWAGLTVDKGFFGTNGFSLEAGATTPDLGQSDIKQRMIEMAQKVYLLFDHTKIGRVCFSRFADIADIDTLITDRLDPHLRAELEEGDVSVLEVANNE
jgi:DeoR family fructose operon transcriptional repressor